MEKSQIKTEKNIIRYPKTKTFFIYLLGYAAVYSLNDFLFQMFKELLKSNEYDGFKLQIFYGLKMVGGIFLTGYVEKKNNHRNILSLCFLMYTISMIGFIGLKFTEFDSGINKFRATIPVAFLYFFFLGGICPLMDSLNMLMLKNTNNMKLYPYIRVGSTVGHAISYMPVFFCSGTDTSIVFKLGATGVYGAISALFVMAIAPKNLSSNFGKGAARKKSLQDLFRVFFSVLGVLCALVLTQGFMRACINVHQRDYYRSFNLTEKDGNTIRIARLIGEFVLFTLIGIKSYTKVLNPLFGFLIAAIFDSIRIIFLLMIRENQSLATKKILSYSAELCKSIFSGFYGYSSTTMSIYLAPENMGTFALGLTSAVYTGGSNCIYAIFGLLYFNGKTSTALEFNEYKNLMRIALYVGCLAFPLLLVIFFISKRKARAEKKIEINCKNELST